MACKKRDMSTYWRFYLAYHRLTKANTPASAPLRRFLPFSPWRAPARLRLKSQKSLENTSPAGAKQFCRAEMCPDKERPAGNTCRISKGHDAVWAHFCPSKPCLPLSIDGILIDETHGRAYSRACGLFVYGQSMRIFFACGKKDMRRISWKIS